MSTHKTRRNVSKENRHRIAGHRIGRPSGGEDRPSGTYEGDESVPAHGDVGKPDSRRSSPMSGPATSNPPSRPMRDAKTASPAGTAQGGARTGGASRR